MRYVYLLIIIGGLVFKLEAQCLVTSTGNPPYSVDVDLSYNRVSLTQNGPTCNAQVVVNYDITFSSGAPNSMWTLQGNLDCLGANSNSVFLSLPNSPGSGRATSSTFSYNNTNCADVIVDCDVTLQISGPDLSYNGSCGSIQSSVVPVNFTDFSFFHKEEATILRWSTAQEINSDYYQVLRSADARSWEVYKTVESANSLEGHTYELELFDQYYASYFKIVNHDFDGSAQEGPILYIPAGEEPRINLYPNPASAVVFIAAPQADNVHVQFFDALGRPVLTSIKRSSVLDISTLVTGIYHYIVLIDGVSVDYGTLMVE